MAAPRRSQSRRFFLSCIRVGAAVYLLLLLGLYLMESRLVYPGAYQPDIAIAAAPGIQPWSYTTADGSELIGRIHERPGSQRTVLFLHGNGTRANRQDRWITRIAETLQARVCAAEYRGFQFEDVTPKENNVIEDALAAHQAVCDQFGLQPDEVLVWGRSLGGGCAAAVAKRCGTKFLIMERTFDSAVSVAAARYPIFPIRLLMRNQFDSASRLKNFRGHLIQIHGTADQVVPIEHARGLHEAIASADKRFLELPGMGHNEALGDDVLHQVRQWIDVTESSQSG